MSRLFRAELLRLASGRMLPALLVVAAFLNALAIVGNAGPLVDGVHAGQTTLAATSHDLLRLGFGALLFATLYGAMIITSEYRHGSIARSVFNAGAPERLMVSKALGALVGGIAFGIAGAASAFGAAAIVLTVHGESLVLDRESVLILVGVFAVSALAAPWGMLIGWIVRSQTGALGGIMAWTLLAESAILALAPSVARFLPGGAESSIYRDFATADTLLCPWGFVLFAGWIALAAVAATVVTRRRDLT